MFTLFKKLKADPRRRRFTRRHLPRLCRRPQTSRGADRSSFTQAAPHADVTPAPANAATPANGREPRRPPSRRRHEKQGGSAAAPISTPQRRRDGGRHRRRDENPLRRAHDSRPPPTRCRREAYCKSRRSRGEKQNHQPHDPRQRRNTRQHGPDLRRNRKA